MVGPTLLPTGLPEDLTPPGVQQSFLNAISAADYDYSAEAHEAAAALVSRKIAKLFGYDLQVQRELTV